jgi:deazaflavin-dependent oxidoreductase (nitroreductase family)
MSAKRAATPSPERRQTNLYSRLVRWLGHRRWFAAVGRRFGGKLDRIIYRATNGKLPLTAAGVPVLLLTTKGRRTGRERTTPVMYIRDGHRFVVSCENFGQRRPAAWPLNLDAHPDARIQVGSEILPCRARRLSEEETGRYWPRLIDAWPAHATYHRRSGERHAFLLEPLTHEHEQR